MPSYNTLLIISDGNIQQQQTENWHQTTWFKIETANRETSLLSLLFLL